jgi:hypothetical protein
MRPRVRSVAGVFLVLIGVTTLAFILRTFLRVGIPGLQEGAKGVVYAWLLTTGAALPLTTGVALLRDIRSWRPFVGWWLFAAAVLAFGSLFWFLPPYRGWPFTLVVGVAVCVLPPISGSLYLLLWTKQATSTGRHDHPSGDDSSR